MVTPTHQHSSQSNINLQNKNNYSNSTDMGEIKQLITQSAKNTEILINIFNEQTNLIKQQSQQINKMLEISATTC